MNSPDSNDRKRINGNLNEQESTTPPPPRSKLFTERMGSPTFGDYFNKSKGFITNKGKGFITNKENQKTAKLLGNAAFNLAKNAAKTAAEKVESAANRMGEADSGKPSHLPEMDEIFNPDTPSHHEKGLSTINHQTVDQCCETFRQIIKMCQGQIEKCQKSGCCNSTMHGGNIKTVKNTKRKGKVKSVKKKRSSQSGGKVHPWREHIKKTRLANPGVKDFGQIIQLAKQTYKK